MIDKLLAIFGCVLLAAVVLVIASVGLMLGGSLLSIIWGLAAAAFVTPTGIELIEGGFKTRR